MPSARIALVVEASDDGIRPGTLDLAAWAEALGRGRGQVHWVVVGVGAERTGRRLAAETGSAATALEMPADTALTGEIWCEAVKPHLERLRPVFVGLRHTTLAMDFAAPLAIALEGACITGVQGIVHRNGSVAFERAVMGGKRSLTVQAECEPVVVTVLPGHFAYERRKGLPAGPVDVETHRPDPPPGRTRLTATRPAETAADLSQAETIVAAGRGIGSPERLALIDRLAACFPKSTVAGSRIVCDAGWLPYDRQVGITGATVAPRLYVACGISGTHQHVAGMQSSKRIVAINTDPGAAIFNIADVGVVEDLTTFLPLLIAALETQSSAGRERR